MTGNSPYRGPPTAPRDKRARARERAPDASIEVESAPREPREQRLYGLNACLAIFAKRPDSIRKVWLVQERIPKLKAVLAYCVQQRLGYTIVEDADLEKLSGSAHDEGVCFAVMPVEELSLSTWLRDLAPGPATALWLDGVGNPHNFGAILRSAAHFGVAGVLLPKGSELSMSGAAARIAEGGAEQVPMVRLGRSDNAIAQLQSAGFVLAATVVRGGSALYSTKLPERLLLVIGAEQLGVTDELARAATLRLAIPGSGRVESLNVAAATAVFLGEWWRQRKT
jgi:TrmH RNA methyltransferase